MKLCKHLFTVPIMLPWQIVQSRSGNSTQREGGGGGGGAVYTNSVPFSVPIYLNISSFTSRRGRTKCLFIRVFIRARSKNE